MKQIELTRRIAKRLRLDENLVNSVINTMKYEILDAIKNDIEINFTKAFKLSPVVKKPRQIYIPGTTKKITTKETKTIRLKVHKPFKNKINS